MVLFKVGILLVVIAVGAFYVNPANWDPFAPNGLGGVMKGVGGVFFAYIGFDAISTTAEECKNPRRDLPRGMIYALLITTAIYILIALVLTGMVHYSQLGVGDPLAFAFKAVNMDKLSGIIALGAVIAMASVLLVFQVGQPRIWMTMSRDGLLPPIFSSVHKKYKTPWFSTIVTGVLVSIPCLFMNLTEVTDLTSLGTLFVFVLVTAGVLVMDSNKKMKGTFTIPYFPSRVFLPILWMIVLIVSFVYFNNETKEWLSAAVNGANGDFYDNIPLLLFWAISVVITIFAVKNNYSLIPVLGLLTNLYLISQLDTSNWLRFAIWLAIGLLIYFSYSYRKSRLRISGENI
jgi:amino acid transporter